MRLTQDIRSRILRKAISDLTGKREKSLSDREIAIADSVWEDVYGHISEDLVKVPKEVLNTDKDIRVNFDGIGIVYLTMSEERAVKRGYGVIKSYPSRHKIARRYHKLVADRDRLKKERSELKTSIRAILDSVTTMNRLGEIWPDGKEFYSDIVPSESKALMISSTVVSKMVNKAKREESKI